MMFGSRKPLPGLTPYQGGFPGTPPIAPSPFPEPSMEMPKRTGLQNVVGIIGDALAGAVGQPGQYAATLQREARDRREDALYQRRQADERNTWLWQQQWERDHPKAPAPNDTERDWQFYEKVLSPQDFERWKVNRVVDPPRLQMLPDGRMVQIGGYQGGGGPASTPAPAGVTFTPIDNPAGLSSDQAAPILGGASQTKMISPAQAGQIRQSLGPNGQAAFEKWMRDNGITIGGN